MQRQLTQHRKHEQRGLLLLKLGFVLTFLLYLLFNQHLYLGDALSWSAYFENAASTFGFIFTVTIVVLMALFLSWVKHHAYLHFGFFGSAALVITTVIGFALFAEFFSSSANQDVKASVLVERNSAYRATLTNEGSSQSITNTSLIESIARAEQKLAQCEAKLKLGKEKHCDGDRAKVNALRSSEQAANQTQAQADIERDKLNYARQDELKAQSYNPVILTLARGLAGTTGDYKDYLKTAVVIITLFVAVCFEILHHFLSLTHGASLRTIENLELGIAKYSTAHPTPFDAPETVKPITPSPRNPIGFGIPQTTTATQPEPVRFKYQTEEQATPKKQNFVGFINTDQTTSKQPSPARAELPMESQPIIKQPANKLGTQEHQFTLPDFANFKARRDVFASPALSDQDSHPLPRPNPHSDALPNDPDPVKDTPANTHPERLSADELVADPSNFALLAGIVRHPKFDATVLDIATNTIGCSQSAMKKAHAIGGDTTKWIMVILEAFEVVSEPKTNQQGKRELLKIHTAEQAQTVLTEIKTSILGSNS